MPGTNVPVQNTDATLQDAADSMNMSLMRAKNIHEFKSVLIYGGMLVFPNGVPIQSSKTVMLKNKGIFDGKWIIQMVKFYIQDNKFLTEIELRKCLPQATTTPPTKTPAASSSATGPNGPATGPSAITYQAHDQTGLPEPKPTGPAMPVF